MRILVIAHGYPPDESPQALRTAYQVRELVRAGHEVRVLSAAVAELDVPKIHRQACVVVKRTFPGIFSGLVYYLSRRRLQPQGDVGVAGLPPEQPKASNAALNWKGRAVRSFRRVLDLLHFPDSRSEWLPWARRALSKEVVEFSPHLIFATHEPTVGLMLGLYAKKRFGLPLIVDLGDPILAVYTRPIWRRKCFDFEKEVCRSADAVVVTSSATVDALEKRHALPRSKLRLLPQGFDAELPAECSTFHGSRLPLNILYTGRFYDFRDPASLVDALLRVSGVLLIIAAPEIDPKLVDVFSRHPDRFRLVGKVDHIEAMQLQANADVLVNIANADTCQVPGKLFEYFRLPKPILHISKSCDDESSELIRRLRRGVVVECDANLIAGALSDFRAAKTASRLGEGFDLSSASVSGYSWQRHGELLDELCRGVVGRA